MKLRMIRFLALLTALMLAPVLASAEFEAVVKSASMKIYREDAPHDIIGALPRGTAVTVVDYNSKAALINYNGRTGIVKIGDLERASGAPAGTLDTSTARVMVTARAAKVYRKASASSDSVRIAAGVKLNVLSISGGWAKVERGGNVGYMNEDDLIENQPAEEVVNYETRTVMTSESCFVYASPSTSSARFALDAGVTLTQVAVRGDWAMVKKGGNVGYVDVSSLTGAVHTVEVETADIKPADNSGSSSIFSGTNEEIIFKFLTRQMGLSAAAACGVVANVKYESDYKPTCVGDNGTSYGICQWHADRKTRLINWCDNHGYDYKGLKGQLYFLEYELKTYYPTVYSKLKAVSNTAQGAYDAGYTFCYSFEAPANRASRSVTRGAYARDTLWQKFRV